MRFEAVPVAAAPDQRMGAAMLAAWTSKSAPPGAIFGAQTTRFDFCLPTKSASVPVGPDWLHEIKYDGYRLRLERGGDRVRLITRGGYNWTESEALDQGEELDAPGDDAG
jgi:ATP-dependent DNA ligase